MKLSISFNCKQTQLKTGTNVTNKKISLKCDSRNQWCLRKTQNRKNRKFQSSLFHLFNVHFISKVSTSPLLCSQHLYIFRYLSIQNLPQKPAKFCIKVWMLHVRYCSVLRFASLFWLEKKIGKVC